MRIVVNRLNHYDPITTILQVTLLDTVAKLTRKCRQHTDQQASTWWTLA